MDQKYALTEKLKVIEKEIYQAKIDLNAINKKLEYAYQYETDLLQRLESARKQTATFRNEVFQKHTEISKNFDLMAKELEIYTGNFYINSK